MITKERLVALINQEATIWWDGHFEIKLNPIQYSVEKAYDGKIVLWYQPKDEPSGYDWDWELEDLREDVDRAKWEHDMFERRTELFEPPMWEDIKNTYGFRFIYYDDIIEFTVNYSTMLDGVEFNTQKIVIRNLDERELLFVKPATKKNYEKACKVVRDLFKGRKK